MITWSRLLLEKLQGAVCNRITYVGECEITSLLFQLSQLNSMRVRPSRRTYSPCQLSLNIDI